MVEEWLNELQLSESCYSFLIWASHGSGDLNPEKPFRLGFRWPLFINTHLNLSKNLSLEVCNIVGKVEIFPAEEEQMYHFPIF